MSERGGDSVGRRSPFFCVCVLLDSCTAAGGRTRSSSVRKNTAFRRHSFQFHLPCRRKGPREGAEATGAGRMLLQPEKPSSSAPPSSSAALLLLPPPRLRLLRSDRPPGRPRAGRTRSLPSLPRRGERQEREREALLQRKKGTRERARKKERGEKGK